MERKQHGSVGHQDSLDSELQSPEQSDVSEALASGSVTVSSDEKVIEQFAYAFVQVIFSRPLKCDRRSEIFFELLRAPYYSSELIVFKFTTTC